MIQNRVEMKLETLRMGLKVRVSMKTVGVLSKVVGVLKRATEQQRRR